MPHALIEFSDPAAIGVSEKDILDAVFNVMRDSGLFDIESIKARTHPASMSRCGTDDYSFIHAELRIMPGRTRAQKHDLSQAVMRALQALPAQPRSTTVEVIEIDRDHYAKRVL